MYHVMSRGNARQRIYVSDGDRQRFLRQLADGLETAGAVLYAYVLMPNHYHLLVRTPRANLSRLMQRLNTAYAMYTRYRHDRPGHLFQGRFKAKIVQKEGYALALTRYIHLNPVKTAAGEKMTLRERMQYLGEYKWSSYRGYASAAGREPWICYDLLKEFDTAPAAARKRYRAYIRTCLSQDDPTIIEALTEAPHAIGEPAFTARVEVDLARKRTGRPQDRDVALPRPVVSIEWIDELVSAHFGMAPGDLKHHGRIAGPAKAVAVELACRLTELNQRAIGQHYGGITSAAVSIIRRKIREGRRDTTDAINQLLDQVSESKSGSHFKY